MHHKSSARPANGGGSDIQKVKDEDDVEEEDKHILPLSSFDVCKGGSRTAPVTIRL